MYPNSQVSDITGLGLTLQNMYLTCDDVILFGDIDIKLLNDVHSSTRRFMNITSGCNVNQIVTEPTRHNDRNSSLICVLTMILLQNSARIWTY